MRNAKALQAILTASLTFGLGLAGPFGCANGPIKGAATPSATATGQNGTGTLTSAVIGPNGTAPPAAAAQPAKPVASLSTLGEGSGWLVGARPEMIEQKKEDAARSAEERARREPATLDDVRKSQTADLNGDGFVSLDEIEAMQKSGLSDSEIIDRLGAARQVYELDDRQQDYLRDRGVSQRVIDALLSMGRAPAGSNAPLPAAAPAGSGA